MKDFSPRERKFMERALELARRGLGSTSPNPPVGAIVVRGGEVVGEGYHERFGGPHAEVNALRDARAQAQGATLYVSLEPCSTHGKTPPCTEAIVESGIREVVIPRLDPNPLNRGKGVEYLKAKGVAVFVGLCGEEARRLTGAFEKYVTKGVPFFTVKAAMSLDGKIATASGQSRWISGEESRRLSHVLRSEVDAVLVGINTVKNDDPALTVRLDGKEKKGPLKVVLDSGAEISSDAKLLSQTLAASTLIAVGRDPIAGDVERIEEKGARVLRLDSVDGRVDINQLALELARMGVVHVLVEGGGEVIASCFRERLADRVVFFVAGKIIGGRDAPTPVGGEGIEELDEAPVITDMRSRKIGDDIVIEGRVEYPNDEGMKKVKIGKNEPRRNRQKIEIATKARRHEEDCLAKTQRTQSRGHEER